MKILLVNPGEIPQITQQKVYNRFLPKSVRSVIRPHVALLPSPIQQRLISTFGFSEKRFPLGLGYLSAMLKRDGRHQVELVDRFADPGAWVENVNEFDFVGVYSSSPFFGDCLQTLAQIEKANFKGRVAFGGPHTTIYPRTIPPRVDYVVQGEAEYIINDLVVGKFPSGTLIRTPRIKDLDALPPADFDLFLDKPRSYLCRFQFSDRQPIFNLNTSRSCPYTCNFCGVRDIWGRLWRAQSAERVVDDILYLKKKFNCAGVYFREDLFTGNKKRVREICELLIKKNANVIWACETRVNAGSEEDLVKLMARSGCVGLYIGAESGSQRMLDFYNKRITTAQIYQTCRLAKKYGIAVYMSFIIAHPEEKWQDKLATWKMIRTTKPEDYGLAPYRAEYARHGQSSYAEYPEREVVMMETQNSTWNGQCDRCDIHGMHPTKEQFLT